MKKQFVALGCVILVALVLGFLSAFLTTGIRSVAVHSLTVVVDATQASPQVVQPPVTGRIQLQYTVPALPQVGVCKSSFAIGVINVGSRWRSEVKWAKPVSLSAVLEQMGTQAVIEAEVGQLAEGDYTATLMLQDASHARWSILPTRVGNLGP